MTVFSQSVFAAWMQKIVSNRREDAGLYREIAERLPLEGAERVLDVGTGTGLQLKVIHELTPDVDLYGLDLSQAAINVAEKALVGIKVDLRVESISKTSFPDNYFDIVTCNASMSYWDQPVKCFNEIYRILKPRGDVLLFEPHKDIEVDVALDQIRKNMADKGFLRRWGAVQLNKFGLKRGGSLGMRLYSLEELNDLAGQSHFVKNYSIGKTSLLKIPIFVCIHLWKP
jgi:ubiquinone/menaquinone biosynthesis C-methylase UbiE